MNQFDNNLKEVFEIIKNDNPRLLNQFLNFHPNISLENHFYMKYTPLMEAVYLERLDMITFICNYIKEKYTRNKITMPGYKNYLNQLSVDGKTALILATISNTKPEIIQYLINEQANVYIKDNTNNDVFYYAKYATSEDVETFWKLYNKIN